MKMKQVRHALIVVCLLGLAAGSIGSFAHVTSVQAASAISFSRAIAAPGDTVTVNGAGFTSGDDALATTDVMIGGQVKHVQAATVIGPAGRFSVDLTIPGGTTQGVYTVIAKDFHGVSASRMLTIVPLVISTVGKAPGAATVLAGHQFYVIGSGFKAGETVAISATFTQYDGNDIVVHGTGTADGAGQVHEVLLSVPADAKGGTASLVATGNASKRVARATLTVTYRPALTLSAPTIHPGATLAIAGTGFVTGITVHVVINIPNGGTTDTLSRSVIADGRGDFSTALPLPANMPLGKYTVVAVDETGGYRATAPVVVALSPSIAVIPVSAYPGQSFTVTGANFAPGSAVRVSGSFPSSTGKSQVVEKSVTSSTRGSFVIVLTIPATANAGRAGITAATTSAHAGTGISVNLRPTLAPKPTATTVSSTTATVAAQPTPTPASQPAPHKAPFRFAYVSVWYHTIRVGTAEHIVVQSRLKTRLGIWVHVYFPNSHRISYYQYTNALGRWSKQINVPRNASTPNSHKVLVTIRLWHGSKSIKEFASFKLIG